MSFYLSIKEFQASDRAFLKTIFLNDAELKIVGAVSQNPPEYLKENGLVKIKNDGWVFISIYVRLYDNNPDGGIIPFFINSNLDTIYLIENDVHITASYFQICKKIWFSK